MIIVSHKKGSKKLKKFDVLNIIGRAGRFSKHFSGRVFIIDNCVEQILKSESDLLEHKNYGKEMEKEAIDLEITRDEYLSEKDVELKETIQQLYDENEIPDSVRHSFLTVNPQEKVDLYKLIKKIVEQKPEILQGVIKSINGRMLRLEQIDFIVRIIRKTVSEDDKIFKYTEKGANEYALLTYIVNSYLIGGYFSLLTYELEHGAKVDIAIRKTSNIVYNTFRYELVKHIGLMDFVYRTILSTKENKKLEDISAFSGLLSYLEYGAYSETGRKASDFGVPHKVLRYMDAESVVLDDYEKIVLSEIDKIIKN